MSESSESIESIESTILEVVADCLRQRGADTEVFFGPSMKYTNVRIPVIEYKLSGIHRVQHTVWAGSFSLRDNMLINKASPIHWSYPPISIADPHLLQKINEWYSAVLKRETELHDASPPTHLAMKLGRNR